MDKAVHAYLRKQASKGGKATAKARSPEVRSAIASKAAKTRWNKQKAQQCKQTP